MAALVKDLMSRNVKTVREDQEIHELERLFLREKIHGVPVVSAENRLVGVVSQSDLLSWHFETGNDGTGFYDYVDLERERLGEAGEDEENPADEAEEDAVPAGLHLSDVRAVAVRQVMTPVVHAIAPEATSRDAAERMLRHRIHRLIVVGKDLEVVGVISAMDLLHLVLEV